MEGARNGTLAVKSVLKPHRQCDVTSAEYSRNEIQGRRRINDE